MIEPSEFTPRMKRVIDGARQRARGKGRPEASVSDIVFGILRLGSGVACNILLKFDIAAEELETAEEAISLSQPFTAIVPVAQEEARSLSHTYIGTEHVLLGVLLDESNALSRLLQDRGIRMEQLREVILQEVS